MILLRKISQYLTVCALFQLGNVDCVRKQLEVQTNDLRQTIEDKLRSAEENRNENLGKMLEKLKEHVSRLRVYYASYYCCRPAANNE